MPELDGPDAPADIDLGGGVAHVHTPSIPSRGGLALTHGAGGNCESLLLQRIAAVWTAAGFTVLRFDLPFRVRKPKGPPHPSRSDEDRLGIAAAIERSQTTLKRAPSGAPPRQIAVRMERSGDSDDRVEMRPSTTNTPDLSTDLPPQDDSWIDSPFAESHLRRLLTDPSDRKNSTFPFKK